MSFLHSYGNFFIFWQKLLSRWSELYSRYREDIFLAKKFVNEKNGFFFKFGHSNFFSYFGGFFGRFSGNSFYVSTGTIWAKTVPLFTNFFFLVLGYWPSYFRSFRQKLFVKVVKFVFQVSRGTCFLKTIAYEKSRFFSSSDIQNFSVISVDFFPPVLEICILRVHRKTLNRKGFFFDKIIFSRSRTLTEFLWSFRQKLFVTLVKTAIEVSKRTIWWKFDVLRKLEMFHHFSTYNEKSFDFLVKNSLIFVKPALARPSYNSRKSFFWN